MDERTLFYDNLKLKLEESLKFPDQYLFKFIVPALEGQSKQLHNVFDQKGAVITTKKSKNGKYISFSILLLVNSAAEVISCYRSVEHIEGLVSL